MSLYYVILNSCNHELSDCVSNATPHLLVGAYPTAGNVGGLATYISPSTYWNFYPQVCFLSLSNTGNVSLWAPGWPLNVGQVQNWVWYVMAGDWVPALNFGLAN
jgi:hypothetical protein